MNNLRASLCSLLAVFSSLTTTVFAASLYALDVEPSQLTFSQRVPGNRLDRVMAPSNEPAFRGEALGMGFSVLIEPMSATSLAPELRWAVIAHPGFRRPPTPNWISSCENVFRKMEGARRAARRSQDLAFGLAADVLWSVAKHSTLATDYEYSAVNRSPCATPLYYLGLSVEFSHVVTMTTRKAGPDRNEIGE